MSAVSTSPSTAQQQGSTPAHLLFDAVTVHELSRNHLLQLGAGGLAAIRVPNFFTSAQCATMMANLETCALGSYDERLVWPRIPKLGPAAFDYYQSGGFGPEYWEHGEQSAASRATLLSGPDPLDVATEKLRTAWAGPVSPLLASGRPMFAGMIREMTDGAGLHFDELIREFPSDTYSPPVAQLAFNCHLAMPESGGELDVFRRRWKPSDEAARGESSYWYPDSIIAGEPTVAVRATVGDAVFFDPRNYHRIRPRIGPGRRVTLSFFVGISDDGTLRVWS
jgi:hypothetical protein